MTRRFAIGKFLFRDLHTLGCHFVDEPLLIADIVTNANHVVLLPRPRRFGKTLAMTMLQAWFETVRDNTALFSDLAVWQASDVWAVIDLKVANKRKNESAKAALQSAAAQLVEKDCAVALRQRGAGSVVQWAMVFEGKRALVRVVVGARAEIL